MPLTKKSIANIQTKVAKDEETMKKLYKDVPISSLEPKDIKKIVKMRTCKGCDPNEDCKECIKRCKKIFVSHSYRKGTERLCKKYFKVGMYKPRARDLKSRKSKSGAKRSRKSRKAKRKSKSRKSGAKRSRKSRKAKRKSKSRKSRGRKKSRKSKSRKSRGRKSRKSKSRKSRGRKKSRKSKGRKKSPSKCKELLKQKIKQNIEEYKDGKYVSRQQAVAVSYSQMNKSYPYCRQHINRK